MLTDSAIKRRAIPKAKPHKLHDQHGLYLYVPVTGRPRWRYDYRWHGKRRTASLGVYPAVSLSQARTKLAAARTQVAHSTDPVKAKREERVSAHAAIAFATLAKDWLDRRTPQLAEHTAYKKRWMLDSFILPKIGRMSVKEISPADIVGILCGLEHLDLHETARRVRQCISEIFRYGVATQRAQRDVTADLTGALLPYAPTHHAALIEPTAVAGLLRAIDSLDESPQMRCGLWLLALTFVRPGELRKARWEEIDTARALWTLPAARTKQRDRHQVPLSTHALGHLASLRLLAGKSPWVLPGMRNATRPISNATFAATLARLGYASDVMTPHGFRAMARTLLDEQLQEPPDAIEAQLGHATRGALGDTYNRSRYLTHRKAMMQRWSDYLESLLEKDLKSPTGTVRAFVRK